MHKLTREEFVEALKVPSIMGRGEAYGVVVGDRRFHGLMSWAVGHDTSLVEVLTTGNKTLFGMRMIITIKHPDTFFAVTEAEYADVYRRLGGDISGPNNSITGGGTPYRECTGSTGGDA